MAIRIEKENLASRTPGARIKTNSPAFVIYKGTVVVREKNGTDGAIELRPFVDADVAAGLIPDGLAIDQNVQNPLQGLNGNTVGDGYDYTDFNRGGLVATIDDAQVWVKGNSLVKVDDTWTVGTAVYWDGGNTRFTDTSSATTVKVGKLMDKILTGTDVTEILVSVVDFA